MPTLSQRQQLVEVDGIDGYWATRTGGVAHADVTRVWNGGNIDAEVLGGPRTYTDLVVHRPYDSQRDGKYTGFLLNGVGHWRTTITLTGTDEYLQPRPGTDNWYGLLTDVQFPEADASSGAASTIQLTFSVISAG